VADVEGEEGLGMGKTIPPMSIPPTILSLTTRSAFFRLSLTDSVTVLCSRVVVEKVRGKWRVAALVRRIRGVIARGDIDARPARIFVTDIFMGNFALLLGSLGLDIKRERWRMNVSTGFPEIF